MNQGFSPVLAHLLTAGLARRALLSAASPPEPRSRTDRLDQSRSSGGRAGSYPLDALEWGIVAFLSGKAKRLGGLRQTLSDAEVS
jgi:hypothetical protein